MDELLPSTQSSLHQENSSPPNHEEETKRRHHSYCRKQKSLGLLCTNFLSLYNRDGVETIGLDDAASQLGVERRRIYDIVNVFESVGLLAKKAKNQYTWIGFDGIPKALYELQLLDSDENRISSCKQFLSSKVDNRREKSLALLTQNFIRLFICKDANLVSLDDAAKALLGETIHSSQMRTKVRRLYDIANVLSSLNLIEKTHHAESRKPAFRWLGLDGTAGTEPSESMDLKKRVFGTDIISESMDLEKRVFGTDITSESIGLNKRVFGTDITNNSCKRNKILPKTEKKTDLKLKTGITYDDLANIDTHVSMEEQYHDSRLNPKGVVFGPFRPVKLARVDSEKNRMKTVQDCQNLASSNRPQYQNEALSNIFAHYMEAWKSWYVEVAGSPPI